MRVYITIDTECREERIINGIVTPSAGYNKRVFGDFDNAKGLGIEFIVNVLKKYRLQGVFFVDPFGSYAFGQEGLKKTISYLKGNLQDIQVHLHPLQKYAFWLSRKQAPVSDFMSEYSVTEQEKLLEEAKRLLIENGVDESALNCVRAGHYSANDGFYKAMKKNKLSCSSNYNLDYIKKNICKISKRADNHNVSSLIDDSVVEYPITNISTSSGTRHCQVTALSFSELKQALDKAERLGVEDFVIVTHSFEFLIESKRGNGYKNTINRARFLKLCDFLSQNTNRFDVGRFTSDYYQEKKIASDRLFVTSNSSIIRRIEQAVKYAQRVLLHQL